MDDITSSGTSYALVHHEGDGDDALLAETLGPRSPSRSPPRSTAPSAASTSTSPSAAPCAPRRSGRASWHSATATGSARLHRLADAPGLRARRRRDARSLVAYRRRRRCDAATAGFETMAYWGEMAAIWAPIVYGDQVLGHPRARPRRSARAASRRTTSASSARWPTSPPSPCATPTLSRAAEERNRQLSALIDASRAMTSTLDLDEVLDVVCRQAALRAGRRLELHLRVRPPRPTPWSGSPSTSATHRTPSRSPSGPSTPSTTCRRTSPCVHDAPTGPGAASTTPALDDVDARASSSSGSEQSSLMVPLIVGGDVVGFARGERDRSTRVTSPSRRSRSAWPSASRPPWPSTTPSSTASSRSRRRPSSARRPSTASPGSSTTAASWSGCATRSRAPDATASRSRCSCSTSTTSSSSTTASATPRATRCCARSGAPCRRRSARASTAPRATAARSSP